MSLLDRALNFAQKAYNYVVGSDDENKSAQKTGNQTANADKNRKSASNTQTKTNMNSVVNPSGKTVGTVGDVVEKKQGTENPVSKIFDSSKTAAVKTKVASKASKNNKSATKSSLQKKIDDVKTKISQKCQKFGISYKEAEATILSQMKFSYDEFVTLSMEEQLSVLYSIDGALGLYIVDQGKRKIHSTTDKAAVIGQTARNIIEAKESAGIDDINEYKKCAGNVVKELDGRITEKTTEDEYAEILAESRQAFKASIECERIAEIKKCNGDKAKIAEINQKYEKRLRIFEKQRQTDFAAAMGANKARYSIYLRSGNDFADAHAVALGLFSGAEKIAVADSFDHNFEVDAKRRYFEEGEPISSDEYGKAISYITQYMSEDALNKFEAQAYDFRKKVEKGEIKAPYMTKDDFTAETVAMASGIAKNGNISDNQKHNLLSKWENRASEFGDYEKVVRKAEPLIKDIYKNISQVVKIFDDMPKVTLSKPANALIEEVGDKKASASQIEKALSVMTYEQVRQHFTKNTDRDFAEAIIKNQKLKSHKHHIVNYLNTLSSEDLSNITNGCSTEMFLFVLRVISPDKAGRLYDLSKGEKCYAARMLGEKVIEESQKDAA